MEDERWTTRDKLDQFRGVTALYNSTNAKIKEKTQALRKKQTKDIKNLTTQNKKFREQYEEVLHGDKKNLLPALHAHPTMQMAFKNLNPEGIEEELKQSIFCKNKELDRLRFKKKNLEENFLNKKLGLAELNQESDEVPDNYLWEQEIANQIKSISVKLSAARATKAVYDKALNILQKDAIRFDEVLEGLRKDLVHQCESIVKAVEMGQNMSEELDTLQREYKTTERAVRTNMKQRDRAIRGLRAEIDNARLHSHTGIRESRNVMPPQQLRTSSPNLADDTETNKDAIDDSVVKREITISKDTLNQIKEAAVVHRIQDICPRMEEQKRQKARLLKQVQENEEQLSRMLDLHNQLDVMLEVVMYHTMTDEAKQIKEEKEKLQEEIEEQSEILIQTNEDLISMGKKTVAVRTALLSLNLMLDTVYRGTEMSLYEISMDVDDQSVNATRPLRQPNTEALSLMELVTKKVKWLVEQVSPEDLEAKPKVTTKLAIESTSKAGIEDEADNIVSDMLDELEDMDDPDVLTRKDIKAESKRLVELYDNPRAMFEDQGGPKYKKHKCF
uniref:Uncharacterized protein n=1 Tax=Graphocephala atropunctata TaxID=36148 RepID=A0A1B6MR43_9HEMI